jgi:hypothetical protein
MTVMDVVALLPARSTAVAVSVCFPFDTFLVFHVNVYGAVVTVATRIPSTEKSTRATPEPVSLEAAETLTLPETTAPFAGDLNVTVGAVVSIRITVDFVGSTLPALS